MDVRAAVSTSVPPIQIDGPIVSDSLTSEDWVRAGLIVVATVVVAVAVGRIARALLQRGLGHGFAAIITARLISYLLVLVGLVYALNSLGVRVGPLLGALGIGGIVIALALQSVAENFVGALIIQSRRPFTVGDTVDLGGHVGVVTDVDSRTTVLRGLDGTMIRIPNGDVLDAPIVNLTRESLRRSELVVGLAYDTDLDRATQVIRDAIGRVRRVATAPAPLVLLRQFGASTIDITIYFWHRSDVPSELATTHDLMLAVHHALADAGITIAFPQMVVWPGHHIDGGPYGAPPDAEVFTERPNLPDPPRPADEDGSSSRLPWRR